jgi:hypothetical protein
VTHRPILLGWHENRAAPISQASSGDGKVMMPADLESLHKYMMEIEGISVISDEIRTVVEEK